MKKNLGNKMSEPIRTFESDGFSSIAVIINILFIIGMLVVIS